MIDKILLGFLMDGPKTGYEIKKYMEKSTDFFFNTSFGSIYPVFKKLEKERQVKVSEKIKNGKLNKAYAITDLGKDAFLAWLKTDPQIARIREEALLKVFFYSHLDADGIENQLTEYIQKLERQIETVKTIMDSIDDKKMDSWRLTTLKFGIEYYGFIHGCYQKMRNLNS